MLWNFFLEILNFLCFYDFYNKFLQYAKEIAQEDVGLSNNFELFTKVYSFVCSILYLFLTFFFSTPRRRSTRRSCGVWPWESPWLCMVVWRRQTLWLTASVWTRTPSSAGPECSPSPWRIADLEATKPFVNSCTWRWVSRYICSRVFFFLHSRLLN